MSIACLVTRPNHDIPTRYLSAWAGKVIKIINAKGFRLFDLHGEKANKKEFESRVKKLKPSFVFINGHGGPGHVTGQDDKILVRAGVNEDIFESRVVYALSCQSAVELGPKSVKSGTFSYIGYDADFIFWYDEHQISRPHQDTVAELFLEPSNQVAISLLKGNSSAQASRNSKKFFARNIHKLLSSESSPEETHYIRYLLWDLKHQVCLGDGNVQIC
ncbi:MAG: hypothetical protein HYT31_00350 [Parcubacteria group bacterium]|nr:hypothetical protein [Parcubacteria group bacterium]